MRKFLKVALVAATAVVATGAIPNFESELADMQKYTTPMKLLKEQIKVQQQAQQAPVESFSLLETQATAKVTKPVVAEMSNEEVDKETDNVMAALDKIEQQDMLAQPPQLVDEDEGIDTASIFLEEETVVAEEKSIGGSGPNGPVGSGGGDLMTVDAGANPSYWLPGAWGSDQQPPPSTMYYTPSASSTPDAPLYVTNPFYAAPPNVPSALPPITSTNGANFDSNPATLNMEQVDTLKWTQANSVSPLTATVPGQPNGNYVVPAWLETASSASNVKNSHYKVDGIERTIVPSMKTAMVLTDEDSLKHTEYTNKKTGLTYKANYDREIPVFSNFNAAQGSESLFVAAEMKEPKLGAPANAYLSAPLSKKDEQAMLVTINASAKKAPAWAPPTDHVPRGPLNAVASDTGNELKHASRGIIKRNHYKKPDAPYVYPPDIQLLETSEEAKTTTKTDQSMDSLEALEVMADVEDLEDEDE